MANDILLLVKLYIPQRGVIYFFFQRVTRVHAETLDARLMSRIGYMWQGDINQRKVT